MQVYRVGDYIAADLDSKIVDPDDGLHTQCLQAQWERSISPIPSKLASDGWMDGWLCSLSKPPPFNYSCLYAH